MTTHMLNANRTIQWQIKSQGDTWTIGSNAQLTVAGRAAILVDYGASDNRINIDGRVLNLGSGAECISVFGNDTVIAIGAKGRLYANDGIYGDGDNTAINNKGEIHGVDHGVFLQDAGHVTNSGTIIGNVGVALSSSDIPSIPGMELKQSAKSAALEDLVVNRDSGLIMGGTAGVFFGGAGDHRIVNQGTISGAGSAILEHAGRLNLINRGDIEGQIVLDDGSDRIDNRGGDISGPVYGGGGDDLYIVSGKLDIREDAGDGWDTVKSTVSYTLNDNVDYLTLLGTGNLTGRGNNINNTITGNAGNNQLYGGAGADHLDGGKGKDVLTGGIGSDTYVFNKGNGVDTVTDFDNANDTISLHNLAGINQFSDLAGHISQHGNDVWISFSGGDRLILMDTPIADIDTTDFGFVL